MRWLIIIWLFLISAGLFHGTYKYLSDSKKTYSIIENVICILSRQEYTGQKAKVFDQLINDANKLRLMMFSDVTKIYFVIVVIIGLMSMTTAILLIARKGIGVKLGLIALTLMLVWGLYVSFARESYRKEIVAIYSTIYESVGIIAEKKVALSPELQQIAKSRLVESLIFCGIDFCILALLFSRRQTITSKKIIQPPGSDYRASRSV